MKAHLNVKLEDGVKSRFFDIAKELDITPSELVRTLIDYHLRYSERHLGEVVENVRECAARLRVAETASDTVDELREKLGVSQ